MIYLIGGAPRTGKSTLTQRISAKLGIGWISTDLLLEQLRISHVAGVKNQWDGSPEAITSAAQWFYPYLERFIWGVTALAESYAIEGVDFLPAQVAQLAMHYPIRAVFLGRSQMTLDQFRQFPGRSPGYANLPEAFQRQIVRDVPLWSDFIRQEAGQSGYPFVDMIEDFPARLAEAETRLL